MPSFPAHIDAMSSLILAPSLLLLFSTFIILFSLSSCLKQHPLDPFTPSEFTQIKTILEKSYPAYNISFQYVGLDEPEKSTVLSWNSKSNTKSPPPRRALVVTRINRQTHESIVDLSTRSVVSDVKIDDKHGYPLLNNEEQTAVSELPFTYKPFLQSIKKRGLNISQVVCTTFSVGWFGEKESRLSKLNCFYTNGTVNLYVTPVEGITVVVDLEEVKITKYSDSLVVPMPKPEGTEYQASKQKPPFGPRLNGATVLQSGGLGFKMDGNTVKYVY